MAAGLFDEHRSRDPRESRGACRQWTENVEQPIEPLIECLPLYPKAFRGLGLATPMGDVRQQRRVQLSVPLPIVCEQWSDLIVHKLLDCGLPRHRLHQ